MSNLHDLTLFGKVKHLWNHHVGGQEKHNGCQDCRTVANELYMTDRASLKNEIIKSPQVYTQDLDVVYRKDLDITHAYFDSIVKQKNCITRLDMTAVPCETTADKNFANIIKEYMEKGTIEKEAVLYIASLELRNFKDQIDDAINNNDTLKIKEYQESMNKHDFAKDVLVNFQKIFQENPYAYVVKNNIALPENLPKVDMSEAYTKVEEAENHTEAQTLSNHS